MFAQFNRFEIQMTMRQARSCTHPGACDAEVATLFRDPRIRRMLAKIDPKLIAAELKEYGAWDEKDLADTDQNEHRILWIAAGNICEEYDEHRIGGRMHDTLKG